MDKSAGFAAATAQLARQVVIVHDKFHVAEMFNKAVDSVRRKEHKELAKAKRRATQGVTPALAL
jgi:transposase